MTLAPDRRTGRVGRSLAWLYVRPHEVDWSIPTAAVAARGYTVTEDRQNLVDDRLGGCMRYLALKAD